MTDYSDLIARLRETAGENYAFRDECNEAADALEAQGREIASVTAHSKFQADCARKTSLALIDAGIKSFGFNADGVKELAAERDALRSRLAEAERERDKLDAACKYHADSASKMGRELEATQLQLGEAVRLCAVHKEDAMREIAEANAQAAKLDEAVALLREAKVCVPFRHSGTWKELRDRIDAFLAKHKEGGE